MTVSIYLTFGHLVNVYGAQHSRILPRTYTCGFVACDLFSLSLQAIGGALCGSAKTDSLRQTGVNIMLAGLSIQAASLLLFLGLGGDYAWRVRRGDASLRDPRFAALRQTGKFRRFLWAIGVASVAIFIRCVYRVAELSGGFSGPIANNETVFLILEGPMIMIAMIAFTVYHPGYIFREDWKRSAFQWRSGKAANIDHKDSVDSEVFGEALDGHVIAEPEKAHGGV